MWLICFILTICVWLVPGAMSFAIKKLRKADLFKWLFAGTFLAAFVLFLPIHRGSENGAGWLQTVLLSAFNAMQIFTIGCEFALVEQGTTRCPEMLCGAYQLLAAIIFVVAPIFTFGFVLSLFKSLTARLRYLLCYYKETYIFSELNEKALVLAKSIQKKHEHCAIVFANVAEDDGCSGELLDRAKSMGAVWLKKDISSEKFTQHWRKSTLMFFLIGADESENADHALTLIKRYKDRPNTHIFVFSTTPESELLLSAVDKGLVKVRRINEVRSLVNQILNEQGNCLFETAAGGHIGAVVVGMGQYGTEITKALTWYCQMDGYSLCVDVFDKDPTCEEKLAAKAPEMLLFGKKDVAESGYTLTVHGGVDTESATFEEELKKCKQTTYVMVALDSDEETIRTAINVRMYFERIGCHPVIQAIVQNTQKKQALQGITNYRGQAYDIAFVGDLETSFTEDVIINSKLEEEALRRHLKWGDEASFWTYEYNYRSSVATAIHRKARIACKIPGADKREKDLTLEERDGLERLEHRRWNAYMRSEGYIYSGSTDHASRNDLAKMHNDLVPFDELSEEEKRKDSQVGTQ